GTIPGWEAYLHHGELIAANRELIGAADHISEYGQRDAADYRKLLDARRELGRRFFTDTAQYDVVLTPTVACPSPLLPGVGTPGGRATPDWPGLRNGMFGDFLGVGVVIVPMGSLAHLSLSALAGADRVRFRLGHRFLGS